MLLSLASFLDQESLEVACEHARRRKLTFVAALRAYMDRFGRRGHAGMHGMGQLLRELDPKHPARSKLEVKTRRLLVANGFDGFTRELPLEANGRTYHFDFAFERRRIIVETNGRRWHDDPSDYEHDNEKCSVPARHGFRIVFATWLKVTQHPDELLRELAAALAA
jgi:very-short-patch-repair endonuclease